MQYNTCTCKREWARFDCFSTFDVVTVRDSLELGSLFFRRKAKHALEALDHEVDQLVLVAFVGRLEPA